MTSPPPIPNIPANTPATSPITRSGRKLITPESINSLTAGRSEITRDGGVDLEAPAVNSAGHAARARDALTAQPAHHVQAANAVMADDDQFRLVGHIVQPG